MQKTLICILCLIALPGCESLLPEPHKIEIQQGNRIKQADLDKIKPGMTRKQVRYVLGTPLLTDAFQKNRWDYVYFLKDSNDQIQRSRVTLYFENDILKSIDTHAYKAVVNQPGADKEPRAETSDTDAD